MKYDLYFLTSWTFNMQICSLIAFDNQENAYYSSRFKSPAGIDRETMRFLRVWAPFCCGWHTWPRSHTTSLDSVQPSRNHPRRENTDRTHLPNLWFLLVDGNASSLQFNVSCNVLITWIWQKNLINITLIRRSTGMLSLSFITFLVLSTKGSH